MTPEGPKVTYICMDRQLTLETTVPVNGKLFKVIGFATRDEVAAWGREHVGPHFSMPPLKISGHMFWYKAQEVASGLVGHLKEMN